MSAPSKVRPKVDLDATVERLVRLVRLGLGHAAEHLADCLAQSAKAELPARAFLDRLLDIELNEREERRVKTSLRLRGVTPIHFLASSCSVAAAARSYRFRWSFACRTSTRRSRPLISSPSLR